MSNFTRRSFLKGIGGVTAIAGLSACGGEESWSDGGDTATVDVTALDEVEAERARAEIRRAIGLLLDREYICVEIAQADQVPANTLVCPGIQEPDGTDFAFNAGAGGGKGYFDPMDEALESNYEEALSVLRKYYDYDEDRKVFTDVPTLAYVYDTNETNKAIGEYVQSALAAVGITVSMENQEWATFLHTRRDGDYTIARNGWTMDFADPICMLDLWTTRSGNNDVRLGMGDHADVAAYDLDLTAYGLDVDVTGGTWAETYDVLIDAIKRESDRERRFELMHMAEDMVMSSGTICPIFYYTDPYLLHDSVEGFFVTPLCLCHFEGCTVDGKGDSISVCYGPEPDILDPALNFALDAAVTIEHLFSGIARWEQGDDGTFEIVPDCARELPEGTVNDDGTVTYAYTLREGITWSDGVPLTAHDFEFAWKRAASEELGAAMGEFFKVIVGYPDNLAVTALDDLTLEVTTTGPIAYWSQLLAFPLFFPVREDVVANENWAADPATLVCNGEYTMAGWEHNSLITLAKREDYWDADRVTMAEIKAFLSDDANVCLRNWEDGDWHYVRSIPTNEMARVKGQYPGEYVVAPRAGTYYISWNVGKDILPG